MANNPISVLETGTNALALRPQLRVATEKEWEEYMERVELIGSLEALRRSDGSYQDCDAEDAAIREEGYRIMTEDNRRFERHFCRDRYGIPCAPRVAWPSSCTCAIRREEGAPVREMSDAGTQTTSVAPTEVVETPAEQSSTLSEAGEVIARASVPQPEISGDVGVPDAGAATIAQSFAMGDVRRGQGARRSRGSLSGSRSRLTRAHGGEDQVRAGEKRKAEETTESAAEHGGQSPQVSEAHEDKKPRTEELVDTTLDKVKLEEKEQGEDEKVRVKKEDSED